MSFIQGAKEYVVSRLEEEVGQLSEAIEDIDFRIGTNLDEIEDLEAQIVERQDTVMSLKQANAVMSSNRENASAAKSELEALAHLYDYQKLQVGWAGENA